SLVETDRVEPDPLGGLAEGGRELVEPDRVAGPLQQAVRAGEPVLGESEVAVAVEPSAAGLWSSFMSNQGLKQLRHWPASWSRAEVARVSPLKRTAAAPRDGNGTARPEASSSRTGSRLARNIRMLQTLPAPGPQWSPSGCKPGINMPSRPRTTSVRIPDAAR